MLLEPNKYIAKVGKINGLGISVYETENGALCAAIPCEVAEGPDSGKTIKHTITLFNREGSHQEKTLNLCEEIFGWKWSDKTFPGYDDAAWLMKADLSSVLFEIVVESETTDRGTFSKVQYLNPIGGGIKMPKPASQSSLSKYSSKIRALAGSSPAKPAPAKPSAPTVPPARPAPPAPPTGPTSTMEEAWNTLLETNTGIAEADAVKLWQTTIESMFPGKTNTDLTPHNWGALKEKFSDYVPM